MTTIQAPSAAQPSGFQFPWGNAEPNETQNVPMQNLQSRQTPPNPQATPRATGPEDPETIGLAHSANTKVEPTEPQAPADRPAYPNPNSYSRPREDPAERRHRETMAQTERLHKKGIRSGYLNTALYGVVAAGASIPGQYYINSIPKATAPATTGTGTGSTNSTSTMMPHSQPTTNASQYPSHPGVQNMKPNGTPTVTNTAPPSTSWLTPEEIDQLGQPPKPPSTGLYTTTSPAPKQTPMGTKTMKSTQW